MHIKNYLDFVMGFCMILLGINRFGVTFINCQAWSCLHPVDFGSLRLLPNSVRLPSDLADFARKADHGDKKMFGSSKDLGIFKCIDECI